MNTRNDKVELLKAIARGEVKPEDVPKNPIVISKREDGFLGLIMTASVSPEDEGESNVIYIGEAKKVLEEIFGVE